MNTFAHILTEIIEHGKVKKRFSIKELAQRADITASYLSNMKQGNKNPPAHKTLVSLTNALRQYNVSEADIQRLIEAYNREQMGEGTSSYLLESLIETYTQERAMLATFQHGQTRNARTVTYKPIPPNTFVKGERRTFLEQAILLLEHTRASGIQRGDIYITWFHCPLDDQLLSLRTHVRDLIRGFWWDNLDFQVLHFWTSEAVKNLPVLENFLTFYTGTSQNLLYDIPDGQNLPDYAVVEDVGFVEARPISENQHWIRTVLLESKQPELLQELKIVVDYLNYLLSSRTESQPLIRTEASEKFSATPAFRTLTEAERQHIREEWQQIKPMFSDVYQPAELLRKKLEAIPLEQDRIDEFLTKHTERVDVLQQRLKHGKERIIHGKNTLKKQFQVSLGRARASRSDQNALIQAEADVVKGQILTVLKLITPDSRFHFALVDQDFPMTFKLIGDVASFGIQLPGESEDETPIESLKRVMIAWTHHPDVIYRLRAEFDAKWRAIEPLWRTDTDEGWENVVNFMIAESLKALLKADVPIQELQTFVGELVDVAAYLNFETYIQELYTQEQVAKEIVIVQDNFPTITMPFNIGPWDAKSPIRTRQRLLYTVMRDVEKFYLISTQAGLEHYHQTGRFGVYTFTREWIEQHLQYSHHLLLEFQDKVQIDILPLPEQFLVNFWVADREFVSFEKVKSYGKQSGIMLQDQELAQELLAYFERHLSSRCPEHLKGPQNVAKWFEKRFEVKR